MTAIIPVDDEELAQRVLDARMDGEPERTVARKFGLTPRQVREVCVALLPKVDRETREAELQLELGRLDKMTRKFFKQACATGDVPSGAISLKLSERRGLLWGWEQLPARPTATITILPSEPREFDNGLDPARARRARHTGQAASARAAGSRGVRSLGSLDRSGLCA